jgi:tetraacyldisaccharide 4'-kinase
LARDVEIAVFDGRGAGNGYLLPAGPLREPLTRLASLDAIVLNGGNAPAFSVSADAVPLISMRLTGDSFVSLASPAQRCGPDDLRGKPLHAFAGIGDPARFFRHLASLGLEVVAHPFPDHHTYTAADFADAADGVILLTEKDAVKCAGLITGEAWVLPVSAELSPGLIERILEKINGRKAA